MLYLRRKLLSVAATIAATLVGQVAMAVDTPYNWPPAMTCTTPGGVLQEKKGAFFFYNVAQTDQDTWQHQDGTFFLVNGSPINTTRNPVRSMKSAGQTWTASGQDSNGKVTWTLSGYAVDTPGTYVDSFWSTDNTTTLAIKDSSVGADQQVRVTS